MLAKFGIRGSSFTAIAFAVAMCSSLCISPVFAGNFGFRGSVGGIAIDASGVLTRTSTQDALKLRKALEGNLDEVEAGLAKATEIRKISLRQLENALREHKDVRSLPDSIKYLAGIQRIQFIFLYPEENDIVFAGPGEGWKVDNSGNVVGQTTGRPVVLLEDLIVALQSAEAARLGGISVSIDPTAEGRKSMREFLSTQKRYSPQVVDGIAKALGPQQVSITGVPETSHFSRVLVAADYRMKRIAMHLEESPVRGIASYLSMLKKSRKGVSDMMPRWWLATDYEPLAKSEDGLAWEIRGQGVKAMTEDEMVLADGTVQGTGKSNPIAQQWADSMNSHFDELCKAESIFGQLRNIMDLCVVAALIRNEGMLEQAQLALPNLTGESKDVVMESFNPPKTVSPQCSVMKKGRNYIITASGGVMIESWQAATKSQNSRHVQQLRNGISYKKTNSIWWN